MPGAWLHAVDVRVGQGLVGVPRVSYQHQQLNEPGQVKPQSVSIRLTYVFIHTIFQQYNSKRQHNQGQIYVQLLGHHNYC